MAPSSHARTGWTARGSPLHRAFTKERQPSGKILSTVTRVSRCVKNSAERYIGRVVFRIVASSSRARLSAHPLQFSRFSLCLTLFTYLLIRYSVFAPGYASRREKLAVEFRRYAGQVDFFRGAGMERNGRVSLPGRVALSPRDISIGLPARFRARKRGGFTGAKDRAALACRKFARTPMAAEWNAGGSR